MVLASEFSRDMMIEGVPGSTAKDQIAREGRRKLERTEALRPAPATSPASGSVLMFGGRHQAGLPLRRRRPPSGRSSRRRTRVSMRDLHATIFPAMGVSPKTAFDVEEAAVLRDRGRQGRSGHGVVREAGVFCSRVRRLASAVLNAPAHGAGTAALLRIR